MCKHIDVQMHIITLVTHSMTHSVIMSGRLRGLVILVIFALLHCQQVVHGQTDQTDQPLACSFRGKEYHLQAKWSSTELRECAQFSCVDFDEIVSVGCPDVKLPVLTNQTCYDVSIPYALYPLCCPTYNCVDNDPGIIKTFTE